jgi:hypothetical protein
MPDGWFRLIAIRRQRRGWVGVAVKTAETARVLRVRRLSGSRRTCKQGLESGEILEVMRLAALYDIHGNLPALESVLEELSGTRKICY